MKIPLSNAFDTHWAYVHRYMGSSVNIIFRAHLNKRLCIDDIENTIDVLVVKHPYLIAMVCEEMRDENPAFYFNTIDNRPLSSCFNEVESGNITDILNSPSQRRNYRFDLQAGELAHIEIWRDSYNTLIELSCAHILTDVTGMLLLMSDFLTILDSQKAIDKPKENRCQRLPFDEVRYGWENTYKAPAPLPIPEALSSNTEEWPDVNVEYLRQGFPYEKFSKIKEYLSERHIKAKVADFFYYILSFMYSKEYGGSIQTNAIMSFRDLMNDKVDIDNINTFVVFTQVDMTDRALSDPASWMEYFYSVRKNAIKPENIVEFMNFFRCLNLSMPGNDLINGRRILNTLLPVNSQNAVFVFNNYGVIDHFFEGLSQFDLIDIDVQDGVLAQEVRMFSFKNKIHFNMMFSPETVPFTVEEFWRVFNVYIDEVLE